MDDFVQVEERNLRNWGVVPNVRDLQSPKHVSIRCPHCYHLSTFELRGLHYNVHSGLGTAFSNCSGCNARMTFILRPENGGSKKLTRIYASNASEFSAIASNYSELVPQKIVDALSEAVSSLASGASNSAAAAAGRTLEGVLKDVIGIDSTDLSLYQLIEKAVEEYDFSQPMKDLALAVKKRRNEGAHFDPNVEVDRESAEIMIGLVGNVISYFYQVPIEIDAKIKRLDELRGQAD
ncbi:DUF4145 domain-containing protein [uncultured Aliiroseovarius sp.]|uniref:DUF4145 domain-containing protein n=1 Tax=uncultured Aliiroseovarius sp. TaxID=1658783 RepID=UPI0026335717|nr:DUF4145 domain-containing protein [uncultured Aliiroseovarius sp.]